MKIEIYGTEACSYCTKAKELAMDAASNSTNVEVYYIDLMNDISLGELEERIGTVKTVPQIFIDDWHVGGYKEFQTAINTALIKAGGLL